MEAVWYQIRQARVPDHSDKNVLKIINIHKESDTEKQSGQPACRRNVEAQGKDNMYESETQKYKQKIKLATQAGFISWQQISIN